MSLGGFYLKSMVLKKNSPDMSYLFKDMWKNSIIKSSLVHKYVHGHIT